jgi:hypothetical protein
MKLSVRILLAGTIGAALVAAASAATSAPSVASMTIGAADVPGAKVVSQGALAKGPYLGVYQRTLRLAVPYGRSQIVAVRSESMLALSTEQVQSDLAQVETLFKLKAGRTAFAKTIASGAHVALSAVKLSALRHPDVGDAAVEQPLSIEIKKTRVYESVLFMRFDRTLLELVVGGVRPVSVADSSSLARIMQAHATQQLTPVNLTVPVIAGTVGVGQTLTVTPGTWTNTDVARGYQWQRCDAGGANCVAIAGATTSTYVVTPDDAGSTLDVVETATDRFAAPTVTSAVTAAVPVPAPPPPAPPSP